MQDSDSSHDSFIVEEDEVENKFSESNKNEDDEDAALLADDDSQQEEDEETQIISESEEEIEESENETSDSENESSESEEESDSEEEEGQEQESDSEEEERQDQESGSEEEEEQEQESDSEEEEGQEQESDSEEEERQDQESDSEEEEGQEQESDSEEDTLPSMVLEKKKPLSNAQIAELNNKIKKTGVVYLSTIPPGMNWSQVIQHLKVFGEINRSHLRKEDASASQRRKGHDNFTEGWVEFVNRKDAKMCVSQLNGRIVGGKKSGKFHDYIWTMKYLHGFKWPQLLELMNYEKHLRADKLKSEFSKLKKQDEKYLENVSKSESLKRKREKNVESSAKKQKSYRVCNKYNATTFAHPLLPFESEIMKRVVYTATLFVQRDLDMISSLHFTPSFKISRRSDETDIESLSINLPPLLHGRQSLQNGYSMSHRT